MALLSSVDKSEGVYAKLQIADVGCGTGWMTRQLRRQFPQAEITGVDLAAGMVAYAKTHCDDLTAEWLVGDMESLPFPDASQDLIFSNLAMQWLDDPVHWFGEVRRVLKPGGSLLCTTLLAGTLQELKSSWEVADGGNQTDISTAHVNQFLTEAQLATHLEQSFEYAGLKREVWVRHYPAVRDIMVELKGIGAHNLNESRPKGFTGKSRIKRLMSHYETYRKTEGLPTTYVVGVVHYVKPSSSL